MKVFPGEEKRFSWWYLSKGHAENRCNKGKLAALVWSVSENDGLMSSEDEWRGDIPERIEILNSELSE